MKNFELFMGHLGNGLTVCNKAVEEHGDYKQICHIQPWGKINWRVKPESVPDDARQTIEREAESMRNKFDSWVQAMPLERRYLYLLNSVSISDIIKTFSMSDKSTEEICNYLKNILYRQ